GREWTAKHAIIFPAAAADRSGHAAMNHRGAVASEIRLAHNRAISGGRRHGWITAAMVAVDAYVSDHHHRAGRGDTPIQWITAVAIGLPIFADVGDAQQQEKTWERNVNCLRSIDHIKPT